MVESKVLFILKCIRRTDRLTSMEISLHAILYSRIHTQLLLFFDRKTNISVLYDWKFEMICERTECRTCVCVCEYIFSTTLLSCVYAYTTHVFCRLTHATTVFFIFFYYIVQLCLYAMVCSRIFNLSVCENLLLFEPNKRMHARSNCGRLVLWL